MSNKTYYGYHQIYYGYHQGKFFAEGAIVNEHYLTVAGTKYTFESHVLPLGNKMLIVAPGVAPFKTETIKEAKQILFEVYTRRAESNAQG